MTRSLAILALAALVSVACAAPMTRPQLEAELARAGSSLSPADAQLFPIHAQSRMEAWTQLAEEQNTPESASLSGSLSRRLVVSARRHKTLVVGGPYADLSDQVVLNALSLRGDRPLAGLTLVFVSPEAPSPELSAAAHEARVDLRHHPMATE